MSKLQNVKAVKEMLAGVHKTQTKKTIGFDQTKDFVKREVGEQWVDGDGITWEQKKGYRVKLGKLSELRKELTVFPNCKKEVCTCTTPNRNDYKMKAIHGMCFDCVIDMEHQMRIDGTYKEYERTKLLANGVEWLKQAELEKEAIKSALKVKYINEDGSEENWAGKSWEEVEEQIENEFKMFKENFIEKLENKND